MTLQEIQETLKILDSLDIEECLGLMQERIQPKLTDMEIELLQSCGMVTSENIYARMSVPPFPKSAMDGYAVCAEDIEEASHDTPVILKVQGEILAGDYKEFPYHNSCRHRYVQ